MRIIFKLSNDSDDGGGDDDDGDDDDGDDDDLEIVSLLEHKQLAASLVRLVPAVRQLVAPQDQHQKMFGIETSNQIE